MTSRRDMLVGALCGVAALLPDRARAQTLVYGYDVHGRVVSVTYPDGKVTAYTYDNADNRSQMTTGTPPPPPPPPPLVASVNPALVEGDLSTDAGPATATASGGVAPYAYSWERVSGNTTTTATQPTDAATSWSYTGSATGALKVSYWRCKVTDAAGSVVYTAQVTVRILMS